MKKSIGYRIIIPASFILFAIIFLSSCQKGVKDTQPEPEPFEGASLFQKECQKCHGAKRALNSFKDEETWIKTIKRMRDVNKADISSDQIQQIVRYHVERQKKENAVFQSKCQQCHPGQRFTEKALTPDQARAVVKRMQEKAGNSIKDEDVELIINYHTREHNLAVQQNLGNAFGQTIGLRQGVDPAVLTLFVNKCSSCHEPERSMYVFKDERAWEKTIAKMQAYSRGFITDGDVTQLVKFHIQNQKKGMDVFQETCTGCHPPERIFGRSLSDEEWRHTILEMQKKAPDLIDDEKIEVLLTYSRKIERVMAGLFEGKCDSCHRNSLDLATLSSGAKNSLIVLVREKFTTSALQPDVDSLMKSHKERENREMGVFKSKCENCHPADRPRKNSGRPMDEWTSMIASIQNKVIDRNVSSSIKTQIDFHKALQR